MATTNWTGKAGSTNFSNAGNWDNGVPTATVDAFIVGAAGTPLTVIYASGTNSARSLTTDFANLTVSGGLLTILSQAALGGQLNQTGGALAFDGNATVSGNFSQTNGTVAIASGDTLVLAGAAQFGPFGAGQINGPGTLSTAGTTTVQESITLGGGLTWSNSGIVNDGSNISAGDASGGSAALTNLAGAIFNLTGDFLNISNASYSDGTGSHTGSLSFVNQGTVAKTAGTGTSLISTAVTDTGTITSDSGTLEFDGGGTFSGAITGAGNVAFGGGTATLGNLTAVNLEVDGGVALLTGSQIAVSGKFYQTNGTVSIASGDTLAISGVAQFGPFGAAQINGPGTLSTAGTTTIEEVVTLGGGLSWINSGIVDDGSNISASGTATLTNLAGASFSVTADFLNIANVGGNLSFVNQGTLAKTAGTGTSHFSAAVTNTGTITSDSGTLEFDGGGTFSGAITGAGNVAFGGGTATLGNLTAANLEVDGGVALLTGSQIAVSGKFYQTNGTVSIASGDTLAISGVAQFGPFGAAQINGPGTLSTAGTTTIEEVVTLGGGLSWINSGIVDDGSNISASGTATLTNLAGASFSVTADFLNIANVGGNLSFVNQGTLAKTAGTGTSHFSAAVTNTGTITSDSGTLEFDGGGTFSGAITGAGNVAFGGGTATLGNLAAVNLEVDGGVALLTGSQIAVSGKFYQTNGTVSIASGDTLAISGVAQFGPFGAAQINGPGTLSTAGTTTIEEVVTLGGGLSWINSGIVDDGSNISASGTATLTNLAGASFSVTADFLNIANVGGNLSFVNQGTLAKTAGTGTSHFSAAVTNTGTITSDSGTLEFDGGGTFSGTIDGTGKVDFGGGTSAINGALTATNVFNQTGGVITVGQNVVLTLAGTAQFGPFGTAQINGPGTLATTGTTTVEEPLTLGGGLNWANSGVINDDGNISAGDASGGTATIVNLAGASFNVTGDFINIANASYNDATGSHTGSLSFVNQGTLAKTGGANTGTISAAVKNTGSTEAEAGTLVLAGAIDNEGVLEGAQGGTLDVTGPLTGAGSFIIDGGGKVEIGSATSEDIGFTGAGILQLDQPASYSGTIYGLATGGKIVLGGGNVVSTSLRTSQLHVVMSNGSTFDLSIAGLTSTDDLSVTNGTLTATAALQSTTPDLVVSSASGPAKALAGEPFSIDWTVTNHGGVTANGPWTDEVFLASDAAGDNPQLLGTLAFNGALVPAESVNQTLDVTLPAATSGNQYFLIKTDALNQVAGDGTGPDRQEVTGAVDVVATAVQPPQLLISRVTPDDGSNLGNVTVTINGTNLQANEQAELVASDGTMIDASQVRWVNSGTVWATFDLTGHATGSYSLKLTDPMRSATSPTAFQVNGGPAGQVSVNLSLPPYTGAGQSGIATVTFTNTGDTDIAAPILDLSSTQALLSSASNHTGSNSIDFLATNPNGPGGILQPGATGRMSFTYTPTSATSAGNVSISVGTLTPGSTIDWSSLEQTLRPPTVDQTDWNNVWTQFVARVGTTTDSLATALSQDATELSQVGQPTSDVGTLLQYELFQASGALAGTYLTDATDIAATSSSLSLSLDRFYNSTLLGRDATGPFGDGWTSTYDVMAVTDASGNVYIQSPRVLHVFTLQPDGTYIAQASDPAILTMSGGLFQMNDGSGNVEKFRTDGKLGSITDANKNAVDLTYGSNGVLQTVTNLTTGETITFTSNASDRITSAADSDGRSVTYAYDSTGTQLLSASGPQGTTTYSYAAATGSAQDSALASITNPDGTHQYFTYDPEGWLATQSGNNGTRLTTHSYPSAGDVTVTDAAGNPTTLLYDANGTIAQIQDALGNATQLGTNSAGQLTGVTTAGNDLYRYAYDSAGNLTSYTDPLGGTTGASYATGTQNLISFANQLGGQTHYSYDAAGNVTGITYEDGSSSTYQYNTAGLLVSSTDADGNTIRYGYNGAGDLVSKTFADGTSDTYAYDAHGNLISATAQDGGTTTYTYDSADRLTSVTTPQGQVESYTYNALGQLATRTEPGGVVTQYSYDAAGRLVELWDGSGSSLDKYTYNAGGQLVRTDTGNGASTTYQYDLDGNVTEILNSNADGSVANRYDYIYNANGQVVEETTTDGVWSYSYDASGQLTHAAFVSVNPAIQNQNIDYIYDAAGNRVSQTVNGVVTLYTTNALNQYTKVGGTTYTYDTNGKLTSETDGNDTTTFTYDENGRLTSEAGPSGATFYSYDALGNLTATKGNGVTTDYIIDPLSFSVPGQPLSSIAQTYVAGTLTATYDYGFGLAAATSSAGSSYFGIDASGNVTSISGPDGTLNDSYFYLPFGEVIQTHGSMGNPFTFSGQSGVVLVPGGLSYARSRYYDSSIGRFISPDPSGLSGGVNLYAYADNNPTILSDPTGLLAWKTWYINVLDYLHNKFADIAGHNLVNVGLYANGGFLLSPESFNLLSDSTWTALTIGSDLAEAEAAYAQLQLAAEIPWLEFSDVAPAIFGAGVRFVPLVSVGVLGFKIGSFLAGLPIFDPVYKAISNFLYPYVYGQRPIASAEPDPHLRTFDGLAYDFQTAGEFVLARDTTGGTFQVQTRLSAPVNNSWWSAITELGIQVGADRVTIDTTRASPVWINGAPATFTSDTISLADGEIIRDQNDYRVALNSGETVNASIVTTGITSGPTTTSYGMGVTVSLSPSAQLGSVQGLLGNYNGDWTKDLSLPDGTVLPTRMSLSELYGTYANAWRVTQATSLLDYGPGQTTATFTDTSFPGHFITLASFPQSAVDAATTLAAKAGITDPGLQQDASYDYLATGNASFLIGEANLQQQGITTTAQSDFVAPTPGAEVGIMAPQDKQTEASSGPTTADFQVYRSGDISGAITVTYSVVAPDSSFVDASSFGGALPSGTIAFAAGQTSADLPIVLSQGIGSTVSKTLQVQLSAASSVDVIGPVAQETIFNSAPVAGLPPGFAVELINDPTLMPTVSGNTWSFDLGTVPQDSSSAPIEFAVVNTAAGGADDLSGTIVAAGDGSIPTSNLPSFAGLAPGGMLDFATLSVAQLNAGTGTETLTFSPVDTNDSGYTAILPTQTVTVAETPLCFLAGTMIATPSGETPVERLAVGDMVRTMHGELRPIAWIGTGRVLATRGRRNAATPVIVRKGALADNVPNRDLRVTKGHSLYLDGALIPVEFLVNHRSILWDDRAQEVSIYHIELDTHDVLLANGALAESYRDDGNRWLFQNPNSGWTMPPQAPCTPVLTGGPVVDDIWRHLLERCGPRSRLPLTDDPDLHLLVDGKRVDPMERHDHRAVFRLPTRPRNVRICSRAAVPQELGIARDARALGVAVSRLVLAQARRQRAIEASAKSLVDGYHAFEPDNGIRWTDGDAAVPAELFANMAGSAMLILQLGAVTQYLDDGTPATALSA